MRCPKCLLENPDSTLICACGYLFPISKKEPTSANKKKFFKLSMPLSLIIFFASFMLLHNEKFNDLNRIAWKDGRPMWMLGYKTSVWGAFLEPCVYELVVLISWISIAWFICGCLVYSVNLVKKARR